MCKSLSVCSQDLQFVLVSLAFFASFLSFSPVLCVLSAHLADSYFLPLTFPSHSFYALCGPLFPVLFVCGCFWFSLYIQVSHPSLSFCFHVSCSFPSPRLTRDVVILDLSLLALSAWYVVHSHTWCGREVPAKQEMQLHLLHLHVSDNFHGCQECRNECVW